ncbi:MAG TPA: hypothetical protein VFK52_12800 [Nocardioidaceae bacterium]|nr:hypothetical protein [Nocardioidaceae bacterium]
MSVNARAVRMVMAVGCAAAVVGGPGAASAAPPVHVSYPVYVTYEIPELTELCGVEVWFELDGTFKGTLFRNASGAVVGEFDSQPHTWQSLYSPTTGESMRWQFPTTFHNKYPEGTEPGDLVLTSVAGFLEKIPGLPARAGRITFSDGEVLFVDDGVPIVTYGEPDPGHFNEKYDVDQADSMVCAELRGD